MRKIQFGELFLLSKIAKKVGLKPKPAENMRQVGIDVMMQLIENLHLAEDEVVQLFANLKGATPEEVREMDLDVLLEEFDSVNGFETFFKKADQSKEQK